MNELLVFISAFAAGGDGGIQAYRLNVDSGQLKPIHRTADAGQTFFLALSPDRRFLYATHAPGTFGGKDSEQVAAYALAGDAGELRLLNRQPSRGTATCYVEVDPSGKAVVAANYQTGSVASFPVRPDGSLGEAASFVRHSGSSVNPERQEGPHAHCFVIGPEGRFAYAADLGIDQVRSYRLDAATGTITPADQPFVRTPPGAGPRHFTIHPDGAHAYVINELSNSVTMFERDPAAGSLVQRQTISTLPPDFHGTSYCADLKITPDGHFLYGTNRGHHSIAAYRIGADGRLTLLEIVPSLGDGPQNLAITPGGELLICANMAGHTVAVFRIDRQRGTLTSAGSPVRMTSPSCVQIR